MAGVAGIPLIEVAKNLPYSDILAACASNKAWGDLCRSTGFWKQLIKEVFDLELDAPKGADYDFLYRLQNTIPYKEIMSSKDYLKGKTTKVEESRYTAKKEFLDIMTNEFVEYLKLSELQGYLDGLPLSHYELITVPQNAKNNKEEIDFRGVFLKAYTYHGALIKLHEYVERIRPGFNYLRFYIIFSLNDWSTDFTQEGIQKEFGFIIDALKPNDVLVQLPRFVVV